MKATEEWSPFQERFTKFFDSCKAKQLSKVQVEVLCLPIYWRFLRQEYGGKFKVLAVLVLLGLIINYIPVINWTCSAISRLLLITVLPYWEWPDLYDKRCLWKYEEVSRDEVLRSNVLDCSVCENFRAIPRLAELKSFDELENPYLPVILPHAVETDLESIKDILYRKIFNQRPCDLKTNLVFQEKTTLLDLKKKVAKSSSYFFHFRLCSPEAVKQSRRIDGRPDFYPKYLPPAYSSWLLMSQNYNSPRQLPLVLDGLIFVRQLQGSTVMRLSLRNDCGDVCPTEHSLTLKEGEGLLFQTELWDFTYSPTTSSDGISISFITETDWQ